MTNRSKVLIIYTGGTIGMVRKDPENPLSPLEPANWERLKQESPALEQLPISVEVKQMTPIDSSDMHPQYWSEIARVIRDNYAEFGGFVILHGTDTMTYTASALSFLLENLDKPVILTGSQISIVQPRNDALQNLVTALMVAAPTTFNLPLVPEVCICFNNTLLRGNRARKVSSSGFSAFDTPNYPHIGVAGEYIQINTKVIRRPSSEGFFINDNLQPGVMMFDIFPGISPDILEHVFATPGLKGLVFRTFGAGNAPTDPRFLSHVERAVSERKLAIVNITQCDQGMVEMGLYAASAELLRLGLISGTDMTPEAALTKMEFLLALYDDDIETVKDLMQKDLRGEQSVNVFNLIYEAGKAAPVAKLPAKRIPAGLAKDLIVSANVRLNGVRGDGADAAAGIRLAIFLNYPNADANTDVEIPQCLGVLEATYSGEPLGLIKDCRDRVSQVLDPNRPAQLSIVSKGERPVSWASAYLSIYTSVGS